VRKQNDLLTGPDFLEVFMRGRLPPSEASTDHYFGNDVYGKEEAGQGAQEFRAEESKGYEVEEEPVETTTVPESTTGAEQTTVEVETTEPPSQVVSVRVSSSVVRSKPETVLSTQDQPTLTAVQRSHFGVEESSSSLSYSPPAEPPQERVSYSEEHTVLRVEGRQSKYRRVPDSYAEASQQYGTRAAPEEEKKEVEEARVEAIGQAPISYQTSVSSATSGSRVHFYREPPRPAAPPPPPRPKTNYELPERVYGRPEANYEVEEAVSVVSNGRAHGVQEKPREPDPKHKFGYVVEGRNFRKYRVEERTADGFIVGEYGVVSHDDGSLRGVRYTADSTINPRLIYDALVKFLSLK
jgi:hypothetical protein